MHIQILASKYHCPVKELGFLQEMADSKVVARKEQDKSEKSYCAFEKQQSRDFPGGSVVKNLPANAGDTGSSPGPERSHMPRSN